MFSFHFSESTCSSFFISLFEKWATDSLKKILSIYHSKWILFFLKKNKIKISRSADTFQSWQVNTWGRAGVGVTRNASPPTRSPAELPNRDPVAPWTGSSRATPPEWQHVHTDQNNTTGKLFHEWWIFTPVELMQYIYCRCFAFINRKPVLIGKPKIRIIAWWRLLRLLYRILKPSC